MATEQIPTSIIADDAVTGAKIENNPTVAGNLTVSGTTTATGAFTASGGIANSGTITAGTIGSSVVFPTGHILQTIIDSDDSTYANTSVGDDGGVSNGPVALSKAYSITPSSSSNKIIVYFMIPQVKIGQNKGGLYCRPYRKIGSGSYAELTEASGDPSTTPKAAMYGNYDYGGDGNRSSLWMGGHFSDQTHGQSGVEISYKFYFGVGDSGTHSVYVNRTLNNNNATYNFRTRTHCTIQEIKG